MPCDEYRRLEHFHKSKLEEARFFNPFNKAMHQVSDREAAQRVKDALREGSEEQSTMEFHRKNCPLCNAEYEHRYHKAAHFHAELCGVPGRYSVRVRASDSAESTPESIGAYVPIHLAGPFDTVNAAQCALETFLIGIYHADVTREHTYRSGWCAESAPIRNMRRIE